MLDHDSEDEGESVDELQSDDEEDGGRHLYAGKRAKATVVMGHPRQSTSYNDLSVQVSVAPSTPGSRLPPSPQQPSRQQEAPAPALAPRQPQQGQLTKPPPEKKFVSF